jgi:hypothetical protein
VQELNPQMQKVSYALKDLYSWLDNMVRCLRLLAASANASGCREQFCALI